MKALLVFLLAAFSLPCQSQDLEFTFTTNTCTVTNSGVLTTYKTEREIRKVGNNISISWPCSEGSRSDYATWIEVTPDKVTSDCSANWDSMKLGDYSLSVNLCEMFLTISRGDYSEKYFWVGKNP